MEGGSWIDGLMWLGVLVFGSWALASRSRVLFRILAIFGGIMLAMTLWGAIADPPGTWGVTAITVALGLGSLIVGLAAKGNPREAPSEARAGTVVRQKAFGEGNAQTGVSGRVTPGIDVDQSALGKGNVQVGVDAAPKAATKAPTKAPAKPTAPAMPSEAAEMRRLLTERLSVAELKELAFDLDIDRDGLPWDTKPELAIELLLRFRQLGRPLSEITAWLRANRPDLSL